MPDIETMKIRYVLQTEENAPGTLGDIRRDLAEKLIQGGRAEPVEARRRPGRPKGSRNKKAS